MKLFRTEEALSRRLIWELEIPHEEIVGTDFTVWDQLQIAEANECKRVSEKLYALALIARRIEERKERAQAKAAAVKAVAGDASPDPEAPDTKPRSKPN